MSNPDDVSRETLVDGPESNPDSGSDDVSRETLVDGPESNPDSGSDDVSRETFPAAYVKKLRNENANYRKRAETVDQLEQKLNGLSTRLYTELVRRDGRLSNPDDMPFNPDFLENESALTEAITELIRSRPGLKSRAAAGDIGNGSRGSAKKESVNLIDMLKMGA